MIATIKDTVLKVHISIMRIISLYPHVMVSGESPTR